MNKKMVFGFNLVLLFWFFLDMTGFSYDGHLLVSQAFRDDGVFFLIFLAVFVMFIFKAHIGKFFLLGWLVMWFVSQFFSHWVFTIFGPAEDKIQYFSDTVKLISSTDTYIPDLYHIILHLLILFSALSVTLYLKNNKKSDTPL